MTVRGRVLVAMSGGVDSAVAAALLQRDGWEVVGCFMRLGDPDEPEGLQPDGGAACGARSARRRGCCSVNDGHDARLVAAHLGASFYACNFRRDFERVMSYFVEEYNAGRTPNPCVRCNDWLKFGKLHDYARAIDADAIATGHHARIERRGGGPARLRRAAAAGKDQSYVLFGIRAAQLERTLLPIGEFATKEAVRTLARELGLPVHDKPDSQEICFVPDGDHAAFIARRAPEAVRPGRIVDESGADLGGHDGHQRYTIGQRRGLSLPLGRPVYVVAKDPTTNTVTVGERAALARRACRAADANWHVEPSTAWRDCLAQVRSTATPVPAQVRADGAAIEVRFASPVEAVVPGQAVVCYEADLVLCGGWIETTA